MKKNAEFIILQQWRTSDLYGNVRHRLVYYPAKDKLTVEFYSHNAEKWVDHTEGCMDTCFWKM